MKRVRGRNVLGTLLVVTAFVACGESLIHDPSFDLWCGDKLCAPWESSGHISRVKTWHRSDFGVELDDDSSLTQLSTHDAVSCIEFEVIADVTASAQVWLEMDFNDDGSSEFKQQIPESRWAKLRFDAKTPRWYEGVRFILRKVGHGRAVLAQIRATTGSDCLKEPVPVINRKNSVTCTAGYQCAGGACEARPQLQISTTRLACGECGSAQACPEGTFCGARRGEFGYYPACVPLEQELGAPCLKNEQCASQRCVEAVKLLGAPSCGECATDHDCATDQVCGVRVTPLGPARVCRARAERELGELCATDGECSSGLCSMNNCAECVAPGSCADGSECHRADIPGSWLSAVPGLCNGGVGMRNAGDACLVDEDCASGECEGDTLVCYLCDAELESCPQPSDAACGIPRWLPGSCR